MNQKNKINGAAAAAAEQTDQLINELKNLESPNPLENKRDLVKEALQYHRITSDSEIPDPDPVITIAESNFAIRGDISFISGQPKAGKTTVCSILIATSLLEHIPPDMDTLGIRAKYCEEREVIYIDTEQPKQYAKKMLNNVKDYLNVRREPAHFHFYNLRKYANTQKLAIVKGLFEEFKNAHLWIIDGIADLVRNINNEEETSEVIGWLMSMADIYNTTIILILHENHGSEKMRGHLGSEALRKAGGAIAIQKDREKKCHKLISRIIRGSEDFDTIYFHFCKDRKRMVRLDGEMIRESKQSPEELKKSKLQELASRCTLSGSEHIEYKEFIRRIMNYERNKNGENVSDKTAERRLRDMMEMKVVGQDPQSSKFYLIRDNEIIPF
jgi:hypothetical protein